MSTALVGIAGVAQAAPSGPAAPILESVYGYDEALSIYFEEADYDASYAEAEEWQYQLDNGSWVDTAVDWSSGYGQFDIENLTNEQPYSVKVRGVDTDEVTPGTDAPGAASAAMSGTPYIAVGAPGTPVVKVGNGVLDVTWTEPTVDGSYDVAGYEVMA